MLAKGNTTINSRGADGTGLAMFFNCELAQVRGLPTGNRYSTLGRLRVAGYHPTASGNWGVVKIRALFEATFFAGLRKAGMTED